MGRGRKAKPQLTLEEQEDEVIAKYLNHEEMNYEEIALALWMMDGRKTKKPMTKMGAFKTVEKVLQKLRTACENAGLSKEDVFDLLDSKRSYAKLNNFEVPDTDY